jgi:RNA ligase
MTHINELFPETDFREQVAKGNVRVQSHPDFPDLAIANYTEQAAFSRDWNPVTLTCRGLIWNISTHQVLARPFPKFFNWDEKEAPRILDDQVVYHWADKADGSLGIIYLDPNGKLNVATRGSFASDQAKLGAALLHNESRETLEHLEFLVRNDYTPLVEICGPDNRIVLCYDENQLVALGSIYVPTGEFVPPHYAPKRTMRDLLRDLSRENAEGWVVWLSNTKAMKIKQADYVELHRMVSNLTKKEVWRQLSAGTYETYVKQLPDELFKLAQGWAGEITAEFGELHYRAVAVHKYLLRGEQSSRKEQAIWINTNAAEKVRGLVFSLLDGKEIDSAIYRMIEPKGNVS